MKRPLQQWLVKLSPLVEAARGEPLVEPFVDLLDDGETRIELRSSYGHFVFDRVRRVVTQDGADTAPFDSVQSVDIGVFPGGRGARSWSITLYRGLVDRITVARTYDDGEASVPAAKLARAIGCKVISLASLR
jgi:hypothetical protein